MEPKDGNAPSSQPYQSRILLLNYMGKIGAIGETRTPTVLRPTASQAVAATSYATIALCLHIFLHSDKKYSVEKSCFM